MQHIPFAISVFNVQPEDIHGKVIVVKVLVHLPHILLIIVVPAGLMVTQAEQLQGRNVHQLNVHKIFMFRYIYEGHSIYAIKIIIHLVEEGKKGRQRTKWRNETRSYAWVA